ncbi:lymphocyte antigen 6 complex locus protein G6d-like [Rhinoderma darwinii]|uniref:lymphocyte antigen 6 complex locus protein G6d-like n=1 Tax=Rhinoderma darwinii TaxID=43563 RepID=UPI003F676C34
MNKWIAVAFFTILACHLGNALECYTCDFALCAFPSKTSCGALEVCMTEKIQTAQISLNKKSCSAPTKCGQGSETTYAGIKFTTTPSCCFTDLCNSAAIPSASILTTIAVFISLWVARLF